MKAAFVNVYNSRPSLIWGPPIGRRGMKVRFRPGNNKVNAEYLEAALERKTFRQWFDHGYLKQTDVVQGPPVHQRAPVPVDNIELPDTIAGLDFDTVAKYVAAAKHADGERLIDWGMNSEDDQITAMIVERLKQLGLTPDLEASDDSDDSDDLVV